MESSFNLRDIIRMGQLSNRLVADLLEVLINVGGDKRDLDQLVGQRSGEDWNRKRLLMTLAKSMTAEELWKVVDERVDLGRIGFDLHVNHLIEKHGIVTVIDPERYNLSIVDSVRPPSSTITYSLFHDDRAHCLWEMRAHGAHQNLQFAGWRELLAYGAHLASRNISLNGYEIYGLGSHFPTGDEKVIYPRLCQLRGQTSFNWMPYKEKFTPHSRRRFYLVRNLSTASAH